MVVMSRKRTRSQSEDKMCENLQIQQIMSATREARFSDDPLAVKIRCCKSNEKTHAATRIIRMYAYGVFDLFHQGHARHLHQAKNAFPNVYLIVGVHDDATVYKKKGLTVLSEDERYDTVRHCRYVDEVIRNAPWEIDESFLKKHKIDYVAHDDVPSPSKSCNDMYALMKSKGIFVRTERTEDISASNIVARIVRDYDVYIRRNLERGYSAKDLNISYLKEKKITLKRKMHELKDKSMNLIDSFEKGKDNIIHKWEEKSRDFIETFLHRFSRYKLSKIWNGSKERILNAFSEPNSPDHSSNGEDYSDEDEYTIPSKRTKLQR